MDDNGGSVSQAPPDGHGKRPLVEDEFEDAGFVFGSLTFRQEEGYRLPRWDGASLSSSSAAAGRDRCSSYWPEYLQTEVAGTYRMSYSDKSKEQWLLMEDEISDKLMQTLLLDHTERNSHHFMAPEDYFSTNVIDYRKGSDWVTTYSEKWNCPSTTSGPVAWEDDAANDMNSNRMKNLLSNTPCFLENCPDSIWAHHDTDFITGASNDPRIESFWSTDQNLDLSYWREILDGEDQEKKDELISSLRGSYTRMMTTNKQTTFLFKKLLDVCNNEQFYSVVQMLLSETEFIDAAFCDEGQRSIIRLIKKLKKSRHAYTLTKLLSTRFWDMTTHHIAKAVIQRCLLVFGDRPNQVLYEKAIEYCGDLAVHKTGCSFLYQCIYSINGTQRWRLLNCIADASEFLSRDPYGNYAVQNLLSLQNPFITTKILNQLKGQYVQLAQLKEGSHVVEKCIESCELGMNIVIHEIICTPNAPYLLAQNQFGNYVIQRALRMTMMLYVGEVYNALVAWLMPHRDELNRTPGGKRVMNLITRFKQRRKKKMSKTLIKCRTSHLFL